MTNEQWWQSLEVFYNNGLKTRAMRRKAQRKFLKLEYGRFAFPKYLTVRQRIQYWGDRQELLLRAIYTQIKEGKNVG